MRNKPHSIVEYIFFLFIFISLLLTSVFFSVVHADASSWVNAFWNIDTDHPQVTITAYCQPSNTLLSPGDTCDETSIDFTFEYSDDDGADDTGIGEYTDFDSNCQELPVPGDGGGAPVVMVPCTYSTNGTPFSAIPYAVDVAGNHTDMPAYYELIQPLGWYKLKDASFHKWGNLHNYIPSTVNAYDSDDTDDPYLIIEEAGLVSTDGTIDLGPSSPDQDVSARQWRRENYTRSKSYLASAASLRGFIEYVKSQKQYKVITNLGNNIESDMINIYEGSLPMTINNPSNVPSSVQNAVILVDGDVTFANPPGNTDRRFYDNDNNDLADGSIAIIATGNINIHPEWTELNGIFIAAGAIDIATGVDAPGSTVDSQLKVRGNLVSGNSISDTDDGLDRQRSDSTRPSLFVIFQPQMYLDLLPHLSSIDVHGEQIQ